MRDKQTIYVIMTMEKLETGKDGWSDFGISAIPGWYSSKSRAFEVVQNNYCDIWETCFDYALIEAIDEGLYNPATNDARWWFKYNKDTDRYEPIDEPSCVRHECGFTVG